MWFGLGKKKTVEAMLADLAAVGIALRPGVTLDQLLAASPARNCREGRL